MSTWLIGERRTYDYARARLSVCFPAKVFFRFCKVRLGTKFPRDDSDLLLITVIRVSFGHIRPFVLESLSPRDWMVNVTTSYGLSWVHGVDVYEKWGRVAMLVVDRISGDSDMGGCTPRFNQEDCTASRPNETLYYYSDSLTDGYLVSLHHLYLNSPRLCLPRPLPLPKHGPQRPLVLRQPSRGNLTRNHAFTAILG